MSSFYCSDVVCPKIAIDARDPGLHLEWKAQVGIGKRPVLVISTTYVEVHQWHLSFTTTGVSTGNGTGGYEFLFQRNGFSQRFEIPSDILTEGVSYLVAVEGLQLIDDRVDGSYRNFRIICGTTL